MKVKVTLIEEMLGEVMTESQHGPKLTFREWCEREVARINETATERPAEIDRRDVDGWIRIIRR
jgi:hypothetical protein